MDIWAIIAILIGILSVLPFILAKQVSLPEPVLLGTSAPQAVRSGDAFTARFVAYIKRFEREIDAKLLSMSPRAQSILGIKTCRWRLGTKIKVKLYGDHISPLSQAEEFTWNGGYNIIDFDVVASSSISNAVTVLKFDVSIDEIIVAKIRIDLEITSKATKARTAVKSEPAYTAFASYASIDRGRVLDRVTEIRRNGVDVFLDCLSLNPGEKWKPRLKREIINRQLFLLFWSVDAKHSKWVTWEWRTALKHKGLSGIDPHPLDHAEPPEELKSLHFGDPYMTARKAYLQDKY